VSGAFHAMSKERSDEANRMKGSTVAEGRMCSPAPHLLNFRQGACIRLCEWFFKNEDLFRSKLVEETIIFKTCLS
jgi:hypothetical protein